MLLTGGSVPNQKSRQLDDDDIGLCTDVAEEIVKKLDWCYNYITEHKPYTSYGDGFAPQIFLSTTAIQLVYHTVLWKYVIEQTGCPLDVIKFLMGIMLHGKLYLLIYI